jgi:hypothetical protein
VIWVEEGLRGSEEIAEVESPGEELVLFGELDVVGKLG